MPDVTTNTKYYLKWYSIEWKSFLRECQFHPDSSVDDGND